MTVPAMKDSSCTTSRSQRRFVSIPSIRLSASAACIAPMAPSRVSACVISLAIIGSYHALIVVPASHQVSARMLSGNDSADSVPVVGR